MKVEKYKNKVHYGQIIEFQTVKGSLSSCVFDVISEEELRKVLLQHTWENKFTDFKVEELIVHPKEYTITVTKTKGKWQHTFENLDLSQTILRKDIWYEILFSDKNQIASIKELECESELLKCIENKFNIDIQLDCIGAQNKININNNKSVVALTINKVGQASCNKIDLDDREIYFDIGNDRNNSDVSNVNFDKDIIIILSHWHHDHWSQAKKSNNYFDATWIVPSQKVSPLAFQYANRIAKKDNLIVLQEEKISLHDDIQLIKCNGKTKNDSGIAAIIRLKLEDDITCLLPGDAAYSKIPYGDKKLDLLVATHHGGSGSDNCPVAKGAKIIIYSFGPNNQYGHPSKEAKKNHKKMGWNDLFNTLNSTGMSKDIQIKKSVEFSIMIGSI